MLYLRVQLEAMEFCERPTGRTGDSRRRSIAPSGSRQGSARIDDPELTAYQRPPGSHAVTRVAAPVEKKKRGILYFAPKHR